MNAESTEGAILHKQQENQTVLKNDERRIMDGSKITEAESSDPEYLAWKRREIEAALKEADAQPDGFLTQKEVWRKFGLGD